MPQNRASGTLKPQRPAQPERLVGVQRPGRHEHRDRRHRQRHRLRPALEPEDDRVEHDPDHEVFPVDVDPPPVVGEPGRQQVVVVRLGKLEPEQVEHAAGHVELARDAEVEQVVADEVAQPGSPRRAPPRPGSAARGRPGGRAAGGSSPGTSSAVPRRWIAWMSRRSSRAEASGSRPPGNGGSSSSAAGRSS